MLITISFTALVIAQEEKPKHYSGPEKIDDMTIYMEYYGKKYFLTIHDNGDDESIIFHEKKDLIIPVIEHFKDVNDNVIIILKSDKIPILIIYTQTKKVKINGVSYTYKYEIDYEEAKRWQKNKKSSTFKRKQRF